jgi:hypothetical protein
MDMRRFTLDDMSAAIDGVFTIEGATDKSRHDIMRMAEHAWNGRGNTKAN